MDKGKIIDVEFNLSEKSKKILLWRFQKQLKVKTYTRNKIIVEEFKKILDMNDNDIDYI